MSDEPSHSVLSPHYSVLQGRRLHWRDLGGFAPQSEGVMSEPNTPEEYVRLAFLIDRCLPGYVDAYYGHQEIQASIKAEDEPSIATLEDLAGSLQQSLSADSSLTPDRRAYLQEELSAMRTTIRILAGNPLDIVDEVESLYGVTPKWIDEAVFAEAHYVLNEILPGSSPLCERVIGFRERSRVTVDVAAPIIRQLMEHLRGRTSTVFGLPPEEGCDIAFVHDKPWLAYNWYLGNRRSSIEFNQDVPIEMWSLPFTVAHETYPGHHTEHAIKEHHLCHGEGRLEHSIVLSNTPSSLVSEGIATNALEAVATEEEIAAITIQCYKDAQLPRDDAMRVMDFVKAYRRLDKVTDNQVLLLYRDHEADDEVVAYGVRHGLMDEEDGKHLLRFCRDPLSRSYTYNYTLGRDVIAAFLAEASEKAKAFHQLLYEPLTPTQILKSLMPAGRSRLTNS
jgi:hypothetical protein